MCTGPASGVGTARVQDQPTCGNRHRRRSFPEQEITPSASCPTTGIPYPPHPTVWGADMLLHEPKAGQAVSLIELLCCIAIILILALLLLLSNPIGWVNERLGETAAGRAMGTLVVTASSGQGPRMGV